MGGLNRGAAGILLALLLVGVAPATAADTGDVIEVRAQMASLRVPDDCRLLIKEGLFDADIDSATVSDEPLLRFEGGRIEATQFWRNATRVVDPLSGGNVGRWNDVAQSRDIAFQPRQVAVLNPTDVPTVRVTLVSMNGFTFPDARNLGVASMIPLGGMSEPRAIGLSQLGLLGDFDRAPADSGWLEFQPQNLVSKGSVGYLIDGYNLRLSDGIRTEDVWTGFTEGEGHHVGEGGHTPEVYSFLVIWAHGGQHTFGSAVKSFTGQAPMPQVGWVGEATIDVHRGDVIVGSNVVPLNQNQVTLTGNFRADMVFDAESALYGGSLHAAGVGRSSAFAPVAAAPDDGFLGEISNSFGVWSSLAMGALTVAILGVKTLRRPRAMAKPADPLTAAAAPKPPDPAPAATLDELVERAQKSPLDGEAQFVLGVELFRRGQPDIALRHLDRSFRLQPGGIMRLLEDPELAPMRDHGEVRQLLGRYHREQQRRVWAGYA